MTCRTSGEVTLRLEMGCAPIDFHRLLPALNGLEYDANETLFRHVEKSRSWSLRLVNPRERAIGALRVPLVDVELTFQGYPQAEVDSFMERFLMLFQRGGG
jgi:hypothetical protein